MAWPKLPALAGTIACHLLTGYLAVLLVGLALLRRDREALSARGQQEGVGRPVQVAHAPQLQRLLERDAIVLALEASRAGAVVVPMNRAADLVVRI